MVPENARFITVEGIEGAGKSTLIAHIASLLRATGATVVVTRQPGGTPLGSHLRDLLLHQRDASVDPLAELLLMFADRAQHLAEQIRPELARGNWVLCDRFTDSTYAYQGSGRGIDMAAISSLEALVQQGLKPGLTIVLDLAPDIGRTRAAKRTQPDRIESADDAFFHRVRAGFLSIAEAEPERVKVLSAEQALEQVKTDVERLVSSYRSQVDDA